MLIFIDSNILCSNYRMKGPSFEVVQRVGTIVLGQIVVDEVCNKFKENLDDETLDNLKLIEVINNDILKLDLNARKNSRRVSTGSSLTIFKVTV